MPKFKENEIVVFDNDDLTVVQTDPETIKIEDKEVTVMIRDFRQKPIISIVTFLFGVCSGVALIALFFLLH